MRKKHMNQKYNYHPLTRSNKYVFQWFNNQQSNKASIDNS